MAPVLLALAAIAVAEVQRIAGVRVVGGARSHDGAFAIQVLRDFLDAQAQGAAFPRWSASANGGLGGPVFYFYPPAAFAFSSVIAHLFPHMTEAGVVGAAETCFRVLALLTCAAWLRNRMPWRSALLGGACYALMPYVAFYNPQTRLAFADTAAGALLPLAFLAVDLGRGRALRCMCFTAPVIAALVATHLPTVVLTGGLAVAYGAFSGSSARDGMRRAVSVAAGVVLGLVLAGTTLAPALLLQTFSQLDTLDAPFYDPTTHFLFTGLPVSKIEFVLHCAILFPLLCGAFAWWWTRRHSAAGLRAVVLTLALAFFLTGPLSRPVWELVPFLSHVQFPFRLGLPISLLGAAALGIAAATRPARLGPAVLAGGLVLAATLGVAAWRAGDDGRPEGVRTQEALFFVETAEYVPAYARAHPWQTLRFEGAKVLRDEGQRLSGCENGRKPSATITSTALVVDPDGCSGPTILPHFYFPGWVGQGNAPPLRPDPKTGLITITPPPGEGPLVYERRPLPQEEMGVDLSIIGLGVWLILATLELAALPRRRSEGLGRVRLGAVTASR